MKTNPPRYLNWFWLRNPIQITSETNPDHSTGRLYGLARTVICCLFLLCPSGLISATERLPNIVLIYADDLGYGDVGCFNSECRVPTPNIDRLAARGLRLTDAHSASTVCTPSRYGVMTGRMPFRNNYRGVFVGVQGPCLIETDRLTLPEMLRQCGYTTAMYGKWHMGLTFHDKQGQPVFKNRQARGVDLVRQVDFSRPITDGPLAHGFDHFFGTACCPTTDWLYAWIDGDHVPKPPADNVRDRKQLPKHPYSRDCRAGLIADDFDLQEVDNVFVEKSLAFIREHVSQKPDRPFFLFHSTQAVHLPSFAGHQYRGKTRAGPHGDFIFQLDQIVGQFMLTLDELEISENTLVIFTSDNGPEVLTARHMRSDHDHDGARPWRGLKRDQWEGGHRIPFIAQWPAKIKPGSVTDQLFCQTDLLHTFAAIVDFPLPDDAAEDSFNFLPVLLGESTDKPIRPYVLHQTISLGLAIRKGRYKYLHHKGSGGNNYDRPQMQDWALPELAPDAAGQLYDLDQDPGETRNLYFEKPQVVQELTKLLQQTKAVGRSRDGSGHQSVRSSTIHR